MAATRATARATTAVTMTTTTVVTTTTIATKTIPTIITIERIMRTTTTKFHLIRKKKDSILAGYKWLNF